MKKKCILSCLILMLLSIQIKAGEPLYPNSVVSNDIDFILETDSDAFESLIFVGLEDKEMPGSATGNLFDENTFVFNATFSDGYIVGIWCHSSFNTLEAAQGYAEKLCPRLGKIPFIQRNMLDHVVIHNGNATAFAETEGHFFVLYSDNMDARISTHDLEETVFHESVHASIQAIYETDTGWTSAQSSDPSFVTEYAQSLPSLEDMPETALFAYTFITHPGRLPEEIENWLIENIPNRLQFFRTLYPVQLSSGEGAACNIKTLFYPNPTNGKLNVMLKGIEKDGYINIFDGKGIFVKSIKAILGQNIIDLSILPNGTYILSMPNYGVSEIVIKQ